MLKAVSATDDLTNLGNRLLVLEDDSTGIKEIIIVSFPENRGTLIYEDKLYDWYGREVIFDSHIKSIVRPFGYSIGKPQDLSNCRDNFIVELTSGRLAITGVHYRLPESKDSHYTGSKLTLTGRALEASPYLRFDDNVVTYELIDDNIIKSTCLRDLYHDDECPLSAIGQLPGSDQCIFLSSIINHSLSSNGFFIHHIVPSKAALVDFFTNPDGKSKKTIHPNSIFCQTMLCDSPIVLEDGNKITANFSYINAHGVKASLDQDCLKYRNGYHLYWYEEHEL